MLWTPPPLPREINNDESGCPSASNVVARERFLCPRRCCRCLYSFSLFFVFSLVFHSPAMSGRFHGPSDFSIVCFTDFIFRITFYRGYCIWCAKNLLIAIERLETKPSLHFLILSKRNLIFFLFLLFLRLARSFLKAWKRSWDLDVAWKPLWAGLSMKGRRDTTRPFVLR